MKGMYNSKGGIDVFFLRSKPNGSTQKVYKCEHWVTFRKIAAVTAYKTATYLDTNYCWYTTEKSTCCYNMGEVQILS